MGAINPLLFDEHELIPWMREWQNMPEFNVVDLGHKFQVVVSFVCAADVEDFGRLVGYPLRATEQKQLRGIWFPSRAVGVYVNLRYVSVSR